MKPEMIEHMSMAMVQTFLDQDHEPWPFAVDDPDDANLIARTLAGMCANMRGRRDDSPQTLVAAQLAALAMIEAAYRQESGDASSLLPDTLAEAHQMLISMAATSAQVLSAAYPGAEDEAIARARNALLAYGARDDSKDEGEQ